MMMTASSFLLFNVALVGLETSRNMEVVEKISESQIVKCGGMTNNYLLLLTET